MTLRAPNAVKEQLENFVAFLVESQIGLVGNGVVLEGGTLSWSNSGRGDFLVDRTHFSLANYRHWVDRAQYSAMLFDGSLLQVTYWFEGQEVAGHRLAFIPCPFAIEPDELEQLDPVDVIDMHTALGAESVLLRTAIRFDYDPAAASETHPSVHMTLNSSECRIACAGPVALHQFLEFVFANFYSGGQSVKDYFSSLPKMATDSRTITDDQSRALHVSW